MDRATRCCCRNLSHRPSWRVQARGERPQRVFGRVTRVSGAIGDTMRQRGWFACWILIALAISSAAVAREPGRFKLVTWNVQMLPTHPPVEKLNKRQALRAPWIVEF